MDEWCADPSGTWDYFDKVLTDTKTDINLFENLEYKRNWTELVSDWAVGERDSINKTRMNHDLKLLENSVEGVIAAYVALNQVKSLNLRSEQLSLLTSDITDPGLDDKSQLEILKRRDSKFVQNKQLPDEEFKYIKGKVVEGIVGAGGALSLVGAGVIGAAVKVAVVKGCMVAPLVVKMTAGAVGIGLGVGSGIAITGGIVAIAGAVGTIAYVANKSLGKDRGLIYQKLKRLYDAVNDPQAIDQFQTLKEEIKRNTQTINSRADDHTKLMDEALKIKKEDQAMAALQLKTLQIETDSQVEKERSAQKKDKGSVLKAMELYRSSLKEELEELMTAEPEWNEETRKRHAIRTAMKNCKSFLKINLDYNDDEADKFVEGLQN